MIDNYLHGVYIFLKAQEIFATEVSIILMKGKVNMKRWSKGLALLLCLTFFMSGTVVYAANDDTQVTDLKKQNLSSFAKRLEDLKASETLQDEEQIVPGKLVVKFSNNNVSVQTNRIQSLGATVFQSFEKADNNGIMTVNLAKNADLDQAIELLSSQPDVEFVEPLYIYRAYDVEPRQQTVAEAVYMPNDTYFTKKWQ